MRQTFNKVLCIVVFIVAIHGYAIAESKTIEINLTDDYINCVFQITWDNRESKPQIIILSPEGQKFGKGYNDEQITEEAGRILINVGSAKSGTWQVMIDGENLGRVNITGGELPGIMEISEFVVEEIEDGNYKARWRITDSQDDLKFQIFADKYSEGFTGDEVASFDGGVEGNFVFSMDTKESGQYFFYLRVSHQSGISTRKYGDKSFFYQDKLSAPYLENLRVHLMNEEVYAEWEPTDSAQYKVFVYDEQMSLITEEALTESMYFFSDTEDREKVYIGVADNEGGSVGQYIIYPIVLHQSPIGVITFPEDELTNAYTLIVNVQYEDDYTVNAFLNEEQFIEASTLQGDYRIDMVEGENRIIFALVDKNGNISTYSKLYYVDTTPPQLGISQDFHLTKTNTKRIYITGYSEEGASLTCNNVAIAMVNGHFRIPYDLAYGKNEISLIAKDAANNESRYFAIVTRTFLNRDVVGIIALGSIVILMVGIYSIIFAKGIQRRKRDEDN